MNLKFYIGQTRRDLATRWRDHKYALVRYQRYLDGGYDDPPHFCMKLVRSMRKYGIDKFIMEKLDEVNVDDLNNAEMFWIKLFGAIEHGYNIHTGGAMPAMSTEYRATINDSYRKYKTELEGLPMYCIYVKDKYEDYLVIQRHPLCNNKKFVISKYGGLDNAKKALLEYLKNLEETGIPKVKHIKKESDLPKGVKVRSATAYQVTKIINGISYEKRFNSSTKEKNREQAINYLNYLTKTYIQVLHSGPKSKYN